VDEVLNQKTYPFACDCAYDMCCTIAYDGAGIRAISHKAGSTDKCYGEPGS